MLDDFGLNITLEWLCKEFTILNKIPCNFEPAYNEEELAAEMKIDFFRFFQEALTNIIDASKAGKVIIGITDHSDKLQLCISDDGNGIDLDTQSASAGLLNMRERAAFVNGEITVKKSQVHGTMICIHIPK